MKQTLALVLLVFGIVGCSKEIDRCIDANDKFKPKSERELMESTEFKNCYNNSEAVKKEKEYFKEIMIRDGLSANQIDLLKRLRREDNDSLDRVINACLKEEKIRYKKESKLLRDFERQVAIKLCNSQGIY